MSQKTAYLGVQAVYLLTRLAVNRDLKYFIKKGDW
jgi:hypothetical protein